jgi:hypothetical protein
MAINVLIVNNRDDLYEYSVENISSALDRYISEVLGFEKNFSISKGLWDKVKAAKDDIGIVTDDKIRLVNGFCKRDAYKIAKMLTSYTIAYPLSVTFTAGERFKIYKDGREQKNNIKVRYGDTVDLRVAAKKGYKLGTFYVERLDGPNPEITGVEGLIDYGYDENTQIMTIPNIENQIMVIIGTSTLEGDWQVNYHINAGTFADQPNSCVVQDGKAYSSVLKPKTKQHIPNITVRKDGVVITDSVYTFDRVLWQGNINFDAGELNGHIRIDGGLVKPDFKYNLTLSGDVTLVSKPDELNHWQAYTTTITPKTGYVIDSISIAMDNEDITEKVYNKNTQEINIDHVTGDVDIIVTTKAATK